jgi:5'-3' exonuclease
MFLILDGNNLAWAGFHALRRPMGADTPEKKTRAALLGLMQQVVGIVVRGGEPPLPTRTPVVAETPASRIGVVFDEGRPVRRRSIFPGYQMGRESDPNFMDNEPFVLEAIAQFTDAARSLPIEILRGKNTEADDLVAALVLQSKAAVVRICSTDRDFLQLVDERVSVYAPVKRLVIDSANFAEATSPRDSSDRPAFFPRERFLDYRAASGDASDNLPGLPGVGALTAAKLLAYAPLDAYFAKPMLVSTALERRNVKLEGALRTPEAREIVERNRDLMDLRKAALAYPDLAPYTITGTWDEGTFRAWVADQRISGVEIEGACRAFEKATLSSGAQT